MDEEEKIRLLREKIRKLSQEILVAYQYCSFCSEKTYIQFLIKTNPVAWHGLPSFVCDACFEYFKSIGYEPGHFVRIH